MTYLIGTGRLENAVDAASTGSGMDVFVPRHDIVAQAIAFQSRDWANRVLRDEDITVHMYRLLLEYGRLLDDNRDSIGYSGDGSELDSFDAKHPIPESPIILKWNDSNPTT